MKLEEAAGGSEPERDMAACYLFLLRILHVFSNF